MMVQIRLAKKTEIEWVNQCYDEVGFIHSVYEKEIIAIAELDGQKVGIGRLVKLNVDHLELGGMYIVAPFRGKGIARKIVEFLLQLVCSFQKVYCIPFKHLENFYKEFGFVSCSTLQLVPESLIKKYGWCKKQYHQPVSLLVWEKID